MDSGGTRDGGNRIVEMVDAHVQRKGRYATELWGSIENRFCFRIWIITGRLALTRRFARIVFLRAYAENAD
jgi:hypothetical protein